MSGQYPQLISHPLTLSPPNSLTPSDDVAQASRLCGEGVGQARRNSYV
jgi:hypothetical protein